MIVLLLGLAVVSDVTSRDQDRLRLIVLTDISSLSAGVAEPDDGQSLIRLMLYANEFDLQGLIATSNLGHGQKTHPELIGRVVDAYGAVQPNLRKHDPRYPPAESLRQAIKAGQQVAGTKVPVDQSIGEGKDTEASDHIIQVADQPDPRPVWVLVWGGSADLAQALWSVKRTRTADELSRFLAKLRVHTIGDQDSTGPWIREQFPDLFVIVQQRAYRGMYRAGDTSLVSSPWVQANIHGHGALGDLYPDYNGGDIWSSRLGRVRGIKEGDTPSFLALVPNGLGDPEHPWLGSWGGRFEGKAKHLVDVADLDLASADDPDPRMSSVYRWRPAFQADFQARLDWCVKPYADANHAPLIVIQGARERTTRPEDTVILDARGSSDPDGDELTFAWSVYPSREATASKVAIESPQGRIARLIPTAEVTGQTIPVLLTVRDRRTPSLSRYGRVLIKVVGGE